LATARPESTDERPAPTNVIQAIARVMEEMPAVGKDANYSGGGTSYKYRSIEGVTAAAQELMGRYCVVPAPKVVTRTCMALTVNGKPWTEEQLEVVYRFYGPGGVDDFIEVGPLFALGRDNVDKGTNKAMTQAFKQALVQVFVIGDGKDDGDGERAEADSHTRHHDPEPGPKAAGWANAASEAAAHQAVNAQIKALKELLPVDHPDLASIKAYVVERSWPMSADDLKALSVIVAGAHGRAVAAQKPADGPVAAPEAETPLPGVPTDQSGQGGPPPGATPPGICWYCEKEMAVNGKGTVIIGGQDADHPAQRMHEDCRNQQLAELEGDSAEEGS
jgi:hypothetical protein